MIHSEKLRGVRGQSEEAEVKWSLVAGMTILFVSRLALTVTSDARTILSILFTTLPLGGSMGIPVMQIAVKRFAFNLEGFKLQYQ